MKQLYLFLFLYSLFGISTIVEGAGHGIRPNIIFILTDDQGWPQTSVAMHPGHPRSCEPWFETPNIARLASQGRRFSNGYAPAPICTPTRRSVLVGMSTARTRGSEFKSEFDPKKHLTIPQSLKKVDPAYRCAHFGKWGEMMLALPEEVGYDESDGDTGNITGNGAVGKIEFFQKQPGSTNDDPKLMFSLAKRSIDFIERNTESKTPFYLQISTYALHEQHQSTEKTLQKYAAKGDPPRDLPVIFGAMAEDMDRGIGLILDTLDRLGIAGNTYVFLSADNGGAPHQNVGFVRKTERDERSPNHPLRGYKQDLLEGGIRVPFIVRGPGIEPCSWCSVPVCQYDLLPTFVELAGGNPISMLAGLDAEIDGGSIKTLLTDGNGEVKRTVPGLVFHRPDRAVSAYRSGNYKIYHEWRRDKTMLYDLGKDIGEENDLGASMPEKLAEMKMVLMNYLENVDAERFTHERDRKLREQQKRMIENRKKRLAELENKS